MRYIRRIKSLITQSSQILDNVIRSHRLASIDFQSGLGDSAYLLYGLTKAAKPKVIVEIGSARGKSACFIGMALKENREGQLYAIDPHVQTDWNDSESVNTFNIIRKNIQKLNLQEYVQIIRQPSDVAAKDWDLPIDILFIDGDHSYEGVKRDWNFFSPFVKSFGFVIFHDTFWELKPDPTYWRPNMGVPKFVEELRENGYPVITLDRDYGVSLVQPSLKGVPLKQQAVAVEHLAQVLT
jgi:predicted O-methyltransferase YrrM